MIKKIKAKLAGYIDCVVDTKIEQKLPILSQLTAFHNSSEQDRQSYYDRSRNPEELKERFISLGIPVEEIDIDIEDFNQWMSMFPEVKKHYDDMGDVFIEKCLEHYMTYKYLNITREDVFIDVAASGSPWANILNNAGTTSYRLDISYPEGIHGCNIGADAGETRLPENFADVLTLHCAFECFQGNADFLFIKEACRILKSNGRLGIVPLYCDDIQLVLTSPFCDQQFINIEKEAKRVWRDDKYKEPFSRHYSPEVFAKRIYSAIGNMKGKMFYVRNINQLTEEYKGQRIYCHFMFYCQKV